jgi:hypothetical protein
MAEIYNSATVTLTVCVVWNATCPLLLERGPPFPGFSWRFRPDRVYRPTNVTDIEETLRRSYHSKMGWTYQEQLLSRRRIYFLEDELVFHCRSDIFCSDGLSTLPKLRELQEVQKQPFRDYFEGYHGIICRNPQVQEKRKSMLQQLNIGQHNDIEWPQHRRDWERGFQFWTQVAEEVSRRSFTYESDVLQACAGILAAFHTKTEWNPVQGSFLSLIDLSLLWVSKRQAHRRHCAKSKNPEVSIPTWSWAGLVGEVSFHLA